MPRAFTKILLKLVGFLPQALQLKVYFRYSQFRKAVIGPHAEAILVRSWNGDILVGAADFVVGRSLAFQGAYDRESVEFLLSRITPQSKVLIVGAHVGTLLIPIARKASHVVGIEANPDTFNLLRLNVKINDLKNVELFNVAAGDKHGEATFLLNKHNTGGSKIEYRKLGSMFYYDSPTPVTIPMRILDDELAGRQFDTIVMDIEGSEYFALQGMKRILQQCELLQIEICRLSIEEVAGITPREFVVPLQANFSTAAVRIRRKNRVDVSVYEREDFVKLMGVIYREHGGNRDAIFFKYFDKDFFSSPRR